MGQRRSSGIPGAASTAPVKPPSSPMPTGRGPPGHLSRRTRRRRRQTHATHHCRPSSAHRSRCPETGRRHSSVTQPEGTGTGAVTAYSYSNGSWSGGTALPTPAGTSAFGTSVALPFTGAAAIVGDPTGGSGKGAVNVFSQSGGSWSDGTALAAPSGASAFGTSIAMSSSGINAIVGDPQGTPENQCLPGTGPGTATIYNFSGSTWSAGTHLTPPANSLAFGTSVALSGNGTTAAVGDPCGGPDGDGAAAVFSFQTTLTPTTVTAAASPPASLAGNSVSYSATVAPQSGAGTPTGTVNFTVGPKTICIATLASGSASCSASTAPVGTGRVYATYSGNSTYAGSVGSAAVAVTYQSMRLRFPSIPRRRRPAHRSRTRPRSPRGPAVRRER